MMKPPRQPSILQLNAQVNAWNRDHPAGTAVTRYRLMHPLRDPVETVTRSEAWVMGGHSAMIMVEGVAGGIALESVQVRKGVAA